VELLRRLLYFLLVIWVTATLTFFLLRALPGDALGAQLAQSGAGPEMIDTVRAQMGLDAPLVMQYAHFLAGLVRGDLGYSLLDGQPVNQMISQQLPPTALLALSAVFLASVLGIALGTLGALDSPASSAARVLITLSISTPIYWTGTLAIIVFAVMLGWLPSTGTGRLEHLILPVGVLSFHTMGGIARVVQANVATMRMAPFVQAARGRGLPEGYITRQHILRVGLLPVITVIALQAGFLLSGAVITESLFVRPGLGRLLLRSAMLQDYPVVQGIVIFSAVVYTALNMIAAVVQRLVDPRVGD
jgi:peptide/nickel transport system permease protein